jgi:hypothetical protein
MGWSGGGRGQRGEEAHGKTAHGLRDKMDETCWEQAEEHRGGEQGSSGCVRLSPALERLVRRRHQWAGEPGGQGGRGMPW